MHTDTTPDVEVHAAVAMLIDTLATDDTLAHHEEVIAGLRKLLEAKDCIVRAAVTAPGAPDGR